MTLDDWIESLLPVTQDTDWNTVFAEPSSPFSAESSLKLASFLKECVSISGISGYINEFIPALLSSGNPQGALTQFLEFSKSYQKNWILPVLNFYV